MPVIRFTQSLLLSISPPDLLIGSGFLLRSGSTFK
jgi:hypothetical protein